MRALMVVVIVLTAGVFLTGHFLGQHPDRRNYRVLPDMYDAVSYETQSANPVYADEKTQQPPVPGTIARDEEPLYFSADSVGAIRAGRELSLPIDSVTSADLSRGENVYRDYCLPCHGAGGAGNGPVAMKGFPAPPSLTAQNAIHMSDGRMFHVITYGQKTMPGYARQIPKMDRWKSILYIRQLQGQYLQQQTAQDTTDEPGSTDTG